MRIRVDTIYEVWTLTRDIELPEGKTVDDIKNISMKWGVGSIEFKDGTIEEGCFEENHDNDHEYFKRPEKLTYEDTDGLIDIQAISQETGIDSNYFISGPPIMIKTFKQLLIEKGVEAQNILTDDWE